MASTHHSLRKAIGALKDSTKVGLAKVNGDNKGLDVAIVKATNHKEKVPKEKHVRTILIAVSASSPRSDVAFCVHSLFKRLAKTHTWTVALKTLIVVHRALREVDPSFHQELITLGRGRGLMLNLAHFRDESSSQAWDYSAWIRRYALYLEERLECFHELKYDVDKDQSRNGRLDTPHLLRQLPVLQELLHRLLACKPEGAALCNRLIHYVLSIVAGECVNLYIAITEGILNLVDKYFEMQHHHAVKALEIYRKAGNQASQLSEFFEICKGLHYGQGQKYLKIKPLPASFLTAMEDYVKEAPEVLTLPYKAIKDDNKGAAPTEVPTPRSDLLIDHNQDTDVQEKSSPSVTPSDQPQSDPRQAVAKLEIADLLCFDDPPEEGSELNDKNSLALAIVESEGVSSAGNDVSSASATPSWELELFSAPSSNGAALAENNVTGRLDRLTLDSLYDQAIASTTHQDRACNLGQVSTNPFEVDYDQDPICGSSDVTPPTDVQMESMAQQQTYIMQQQQQPPMVGYDSTIPSGNPFVEHSMPSQPPENSYSGLI
ncbi:AP180 N-terminal homology (ANTH) domain - like 10 [Theobroma cacao]|nr:AP180 N-terminal homology (ANTH) domain - like 10 [Theobroma cacao]